MLFQPPYCEGLSPEFSSGACKPRPEVNPIERVWQYIKYRLRCCCTRSARPLLFINLDDVKEKVAHVLKNLRQDIIISLAGWDC